jgi:hypothetical protein
MEMRHARWADIVSRCEAYEAPKTGYGTVSRRSLARIQRRVGCAGARATAQQISLANHTNCSR